MISIMRPNKIRSLSVMCKRNIVFFQQQCDDIVQQPDIQLAVIRMPPFPRQPILIVQIVIAALMLTITSPTGSGEAPDSYRPGDGDRFWRISTRRLPKNPCQSQLDSPALDVRSVTACGQSTPSTWEDYIQTVGDGTRDAVIYVHGNRMDRENAIKYGLMIYRKSACRRKGRPIDWIIWSWPSEKNGILIHDARRKANRCDTQALYLSWVLRRHVEQNVPTALIGFSYGGRIITGALHALAGGKLGGRSLPEPPITGMPFDAALLAAAVDSNCMSRCGIHNRATKNLDRLVLLYNRKDVVLKRYWRLERIRGNTALGFSGSRSFAPRADGTALSVRSRDCSSGVGIQHNEMDYYEHPCFAGSEIANLIDDLQINH